MSGAVHTRISHLRNLLKKHNGSRALRFLETHNGLSGRIVEAARATRACGTTVEYDGMWSSSLTASTAKGKPDIEVVDTTERLSLVRETLSVTTKPMIYDADTGGLEEIFRFTVRSLEELGVSAAIIEDKTGLKQNSLFGTERKQQLEDIDSFCSKIQAGQAARRDPNFMVVSRIEALIAGWGSEEALTRARAYVDAGVDAVMIHSKEKDPAEVLHFLDEFHKFPKTVPVVVVPTTYNSLTEEDLHKAGASIVIHANHLIRAAYAPMQDCAASILQHSRSQEIEDAGALMGVKKILTLIDEDPSGNAADPAQVADRIAALEEELAALKSQ